MFKQPGKSLKVLAKSQSSLVIIGVSIVSIFMMGDDFGLAMLILCCGVSYAFLSCIGLYAFGELVDSAEETKNSVNEILRRTVAIDYANSNGIPMNNQQSAYSLEEMQKQRLTQAKNSAEIWTCRQCGDTNSKSVRVCKGCGNQR